MEMKTALKNCCKVISPGANHMMFIDIEGKLYGCGYNNYGQLGDGTTARRESPVQIKKDSRFIYVSAGVYHTVAIDNEGRLYTWGENEHGELGDGTTISRLIPKHIMTKTRFIYISAGRHHTLAIDNEGKLYIWGNFIQPGDDMATDHLTPERIMKETRFICVSAGFCYTVAIDNKGKLYTWGENSYGQLGDGTTISRAIPKHIMKAKRFTDVSAGEEHTVAIDNEGKLYTWGDNNYGQLGDGTMKNYSLKPKQIMTAKRFTDVSAGEFHTVALDSKGKIYCWGCNRNGQLGDGTTENCLKPKQIMIEKRFTCVSAGGDQTVAIDNEGKLYKWGDNNYGQLGDGTTNNNCLNPKQIMTGIRFGSLNRSMENEVVNLEKNTVYSEYGLSLENVTEENIVAGCVEAGIPVFLHGSSGDGKSARVEQIDPQCEKIYLASRTPDSLIGKTIFNQEKGELIELKPTWLTNLERKCEEEKDKIHILFFDELSNALHSIQAMVFDIVLKREVDGRWKLPENARIVAAGNETEDSLAANVLAEPLFNRFAHVYIETTLESWLKWANTPKETVNCIQYIKEDESNKKIHPLIYSYISCKGGDVLRTTFNGEKPNADPRKWEMASKLLYSTKKPYMLRALVGEEITAEFIEFCNQQMITIQGVLDNKYTDSMVNDLTVAEKYMALGILSEVKEENFEVVRNFVKKFGPEFLASFENSWIAGNEKRLEIVAEYRIEV